MQTVRVDVPCVKLGGGSTQRVFNNFAKMCKEETHIYKTFVSVKLFIIILNFTFFLWSPVKWNQKSISNHAGAPKVSSALQLHGVILTVSRDTDTRTNGGDQPSAHSLKHPSHLFLGSVAQNTCTLF